MFGSSGASAGHSSHKLTVEHDDESLLDEVQALVQPDTLAALTGTSELPTGSPAEVRALLRRYLLAEKRDVAKTAARLAQQADWRRQFGIVTLVGGRAGGWQAVGDGGRDGSDGRAGRGG